MELPDKSIWLALHSNSPIRTYRPWQALKCHWTFNQNNLLMFLCPNKTSAAFFVLQLYFLATRLRMCVSYCSSHCRIQSCLLDTLCCISVSFWNCGINTWINSSGEFGANERTCYITKQHRWYLDKRTGRASSDLLSHRTSAWLHTYLRSLKAKDED